MDDDVFFLIDCYIIPYKKGNLRAGPAPTIFLGSTCLAAYFLTWMAFAKKTEEISIKAIYNFLGIWFFNDYLFSNDFHSIIIKIK